LDVGKVIPRTRFALKHPKVALGYLRFGKEGFTRHQISNLIEVDKATVAKVYGSILDDTELERQIGEALSGVFYGQVSFTVGHLLYALCRLLKPKVVVETGVSSGVSSAFILKALKDNSGGILHSIDLPALPPGLKVGFVVPKDLESSWNLHLGVSSQLLPKLISDLEAVDIFVHDSEHTYVNMMFEYETAWPWIREGGLLLSDDVNRNQAFGEFAHRINRRVRFLYGRGFAGLCK
jgi:hypothetical protein